MPEQLIELPVRKTIRVAASQEWAFAVFTGGFDDWWPKSHHIGKAPLKKAIIEPRPGGRCYSEQTDGTECDWGTVLVWEPPSRFVMAWQISPGWGYEPDLAKSSEVEVRFTAEADGKTRVNLEHRYLERYGPDGLAMRQAVEGPNGWGDLLQLYAERIAKGSP